MKKLSQILAEEGLTKEAGRTVNVTLPVEYDKMRAEDLFQFTNEELLGEYEGFDKVLKFLKLKQIDDAKILGGDQVDWLGQAFKTKGSIMLPGDFGDVSAQIGYLGKTPCLRIPNAYPVYLIK